MKKVFSILLLSMLLLVACTSAPMFDRTEGEVKSEAFLALLKTDPATAYGETSLAFQEITSEEDFSTFSQGLIVQHLTDITLTGISSNSAVYNSKYDGPYAQITLSGDSNFDDGSSGRITLVWSYNFDESAWELDSISFKAKTQ